jgi:hypothetical protein
MTQDEQIIECEERLLEAIKTGNIQVLDELLHDNLFFNIPTGQTITKEMDIENYRLGIMTFYNISTSDLSIKTTENVATVVVTVCLKAKYADKIIDRKFSYLRVWKLFNNHWKVTARSGFQIQ